MAARSKDKTAKGKSEPGAADAARAEPRGAAGAPLVLVVDDFTDNREMYARYLEFSGFRVVTAANGQEALDRAFERVPDLVVMDLSLPGVDGWEATRRLKKDARTKDVPVVAVTGHAFAGSSESALQAGCDGYIMKPCLPTDLVGEIKRVLAGGKGSKSGKRS